MSTLRPGTSNVILNTNIKGWQETWLWPVLKHAAGFRLEIEHNSFYIVYMFPTGLPRTPKCECDKHGRKEKWVGNVKEGNSLEYLGINMRVTFSLISKNMMVGYGLRTSGSVQEPMAECCEHGDELSVS
jgi:hypothetical protein